MGISLSLLACAIMGRLLKPHSTFKEGSQYSAVFFLEETVFLHVYVLSLNTLLGFPPFNYMHVPIAQLNLVLLNIIQRYFMSRDACLFHCIFRGIGYKYE